jgi:hypothetical protein
MDLVAGAKILHERLAGLTPPDPPAAPPQPEPEPVAAPPNAVVARIAGWVGFRRRD